MITHKIRRNAFRGLQGLFTGEIIGMLVVALKYGLLADETALVAVVLTGINLVVLGLVIWDTLQMRRANEKHTRL